MSRIALCGAFDIPNFGDHLYPPVLRKMLQRRGLADEIVLFSPFDATEAFTDGSRVYSLSNLEKMHNEDPFSAIIVGGGEIIHWRKYGQRLAFGDTDFVDYPMHEIWVIPALMKMKYGIPVLWNAPGIPYDFDDDRDHANRIFNTVDYISVRNDFSKQVLITRGVNAEAISVVPDTAFAIPTIFPKQDLDAFRKRSFPNLDRYVVFHCNRFIPEDSIDGVVSLLRSLHDDAYTVVLLPLAYTHGDDEILKKLASHLDFDTFIPANVLSLTEIISILAGCSLYIGTSLHGSVVASSYEKPVVAFDYHQNVKTRDLFTSLGLERFYADNINDVHTAVQEALSHSKPVDIQTLISQLNLHFDSLHGAITTDTHSQNIGIQESADIIYQAFFDAERAKNLQELIDTTTQTNKELADLNDQLNAAREQLTDENLRLNELAEYQKYISEYWEMRHNEVGLVVYDLNRQLAEYHHNVRHPIPATARHIMRRLRSLRRHN
ncbi:polysaccharide pyruvyl transferase family protein [Arcanobacterium bovis]|uniref:Polysaccharide pyruvyl transferase family protein n=1 Tax=Arcanobacterium bovis TaxID=2529275 RepID=A0A4Q9V219_9ACTO|nr:polysaccharide pyruvyl transferase family protein [Arcanobacterium bovis]TBW23640.1 polysaccharide pyruvyl transferase family protein [Arcanobacterium bovis]